MSAGISDSNVVYPKGLGGSKAAEEPLFSWGCEERQVEDAWRGFIVQSGSVTSAGRTWERTLRKLFQSESESVIRVWVVGGGVAQYLSPWDFEQSQRVHDAVALLDEWLKDDSGYDEETWPELKESLDRNRLSDRKLFDG